MIKNAKQFFGWWTSEFKTWMTAKVNSIISAIPTDYAKDATVAKETTASAISGKIGTPSAGKPQTIFAALEEGTGGGITPEQYNALAKEAQATLNKEAILNKIDTITIDTSTLATKAAQTAQTAQLTTLQQRLAVSTAYTATAIPTATATEAAQNHVKAVQGAVTSDPSAATNYQSHAIVRIKHAATDTDNATELASLERNLVYGGTTTSKSWQSAGQTITAQVPDTGYGFTEFWLKDGNNWIHYTSSLPSAQDNINTLHPALHTTTTDQQGNITRTPQHIISLTNPN